MMACTPQIFLTLAITLMLKIPGAKEPPSLTSWFIKAPLCNMLLFACLEVHSTRCPPGGPVQGEAQGRPHIIFGFAGQMEMHSVMWGNLLVFVNLGLVTGPALITGYAIMTRRVFCLFVIFIMHDHSVIMQSQYHHCECGRYKKKFGTQCAQCYSKAGKSSLETELLPQTVDKPPVANDGIMTAVPKDATAAPAPTTGGSIYDGM